LNTVKNMPEKTGYYLVATEDESVLRVLFINDHNRSLEQHRSCLNVCVETGVLAALILSIYRSLRWDLTHKINGRTTLQEAVELLDLATGINIPTFTIIQALTSYLGECLITGNIEL